MISLPHISLRSPRTKGLVAALLLTGCGPGLDDGAGPREVTQVLGPSGGEVVLSQGRFTFSPDSLATNTTVTVRRMPTGLAGGALGAVFQVELPLGIGLGKQDPIATIAVPADSDRDHVRLGFLSVAGPADEPRYWIPVQESAFDPSEVAVNGPMAAFRDKPNVVQFAAVFTCSLGNKCPSGRICQSGACQ